MTKIIGYTALHYGKEYLGFALKSVIDYLDEYYVLYSPVGSHGHRTPQPCPDTRDELYAIARAVAGDKLTWIDGDWQFEGEQRDSIMEHCPGADLILVLDADEIWPQGVMQQIRQFDDFEYQYFRHPIIHFWRSFSRAVLHDPAYPVRLIRPKGSGTWTPAANAPICHMGYAQSPTITQYKQYTHGHRNEWRTDCNWFEDKFLANAQTDCHPCGSVYWNTEVVDPRDYMPAFMEHHPYWGLDVIE